MAISCKLRTITGNASLGIHWTSRGCRTMREAEPENNQGDKLANLERAESGDDDANSEHPEIGFYM